MEYPWSLFTCKYIFFILFFSLFVSDLLLLCLPLCSRQPPQPNHKTTTWPGLSQRLTQPKNTNSEIGNQTQNHYQQNQTQTKINPNPNSEIITRNIKTKINLNPTNWKTQNKTIIRKPITQTQTWLASWQPNSGRMSELGAIDEVQQRERERESEREISSGLCHSCWWLQQWREFVGEKEWEMWSGLLWVMGFGMRESSEERETFERNKLGKREITGKGMKLIIKKDWKMII